MRVSADKLDIGYTPLHMHFEVYCDDVLMTDCRTADDVEGMVLRVKCGVDGRLVIDQATGLVATFVQRGRIRIVDRRAL